MKLNELLTEAPVAPAQATAPAAAPAPAAKPAGMVDKAVGGMAKLAGGIGKATSAVQQGFDKYQTMAKGGKAGSTPFDDVNHNALAKTIDKILNGQPLAPEELSELKELRKKL